MKHKIDALKIVQLAVEAGEAIMKIYSQDFGVEIKEDNSPLTEADKSANKVIVKGLKHLYPDIPIISEENKLLPYSERKDWEYFWLVDPLDGTKEFIKKNGEFTVNIALIHKHTPVFGVVHIPAQKITYYGGLENSTRKVNEAGKVEELKNRHVNYLDKKEVTVVASRSHMTKETEDFVKQLTEEGKQVEMVSSGSSLKFCLVAEGKADVYPRFGPTMEWDTAAAHAVAIYAGRQVVRFDTKTPLEYNKENLLNPWFIVE